MDTRLHNMRGAYLVLHERVMTALQTQVGDSVQLTIVRDQCTGLAASAAQVCLALCNLLLHLIYAHVVFHCSMNLCFHL